MLDLCSGKGGDIFKWAKARISHYVGVEYSHALNLKAMNRIEKAQKFQMPVILVSNDAADTQFSIKEVLHKEEQFKRFGKNIVFDIVSC